MKKTQVFLRKHSSTILTVIGAGGVVATAVLAVKATPKALQLIEDEKNRQNSDLFLDSMANDWAAYEPVEKLKPIEMIKVAWKPYIPAVVTGVSTIACIFGANVLNKRHQAALMSAYAVLDSSYKEYREKTKTLYGEDAKRIDHEIVKSKLDDVQEEPDKELFFDMHTMQSFYATLEEVEEAEKLFNQNFLSSGFAYLNDYCEIMGMELKDYGYDIGWVATEGEIKFEHEKAVMDDGLECWIISMVYPPTIECEC